MKTVSFGWQFFFLINRLPDNMHRFDNTLSELASISYTGENWDLFYIRVRYFWSYSFTGRKEVIRIFHALDMWLRGLVGSSTQLLWGWEAWVQSPFKPEFLQISFTAIILISVGHLRQLRVLKNDVGVFNQPWVACILTGLEVCTTTQ